MVSARFNVSVLVLLACALIPLTIPQLENVSGQAMPITSFTRTPDGYNNQTGSFTLSGEFGYETRNGRSNVCMSYEYFTFNAQAGQSLQGNLQPGNSGKPFYYFILTSYPQFALFSQYGCSAPNYWKPQLFNSGSTLSWVAPEDGRYVLVFFTGGFYSGSVYFTT